MLKGKWKLLICVALITCVIFTASNNVFAAINKSYYDNNIAKDGVYDDQVEQKIASSSLLDAIGSFIYSIGSLIELLLAKVFQLVTGTNMFPWADAILYNAVPFLDANIFTASGGSLVSIVYDFLTGTYYSLLTLASTFFGIAVMFSAVKLAITAIAEDKAKYKKAIVDWLLGLVMLWGIHFFMSFILYLNEQLVVVASSISAEEVAEKGEALLEATNTDKDAVEIVENFILRMTEAHFTFSWQKPALWDSEIGTGKDFMGDDYYDYKKITYDDAEQVIKDNPKIAASLLNNTNFQDYVFQHRIIWNDKLHGFSAASKTYVQALGLHVKHIVDMTTDELEKYEGVIEHIYNMKNKTDEEINFYNYLNAMYNTAQKYVFGNNSEKASAFVANLANYFKEAAWTRTQSSWKNDKVSVSNAIMYVIFVCYSVVFFISYTKRLFYIIMLTLMAPIVVVFDFFMKFGK